MLTRDTGTVVAVLIVVVLAGCLSAPSIPDADASSVERTDDDPSTAALSFAESTAGTGLEYAAVDDGAGNGNDGLYVADYDNDLREDVLAIGGPSPVLFHNTGEGYERSNALPNVSEATAGRVQSALWMDHDNDGWEDLLLLRRDGTAVFLENDEGSFERRAVGLETTFDNPVGASTADYDGDGCLDLFVIQYGLWEETTPSAWNNPFFDADNGKQNALYRGSCGDGFERVEDAGVGPGETGPHWSLATSFTDLTGDGNPDIHVANDYYNDTVYYNDGDGTFTREYVAGFSDRNGMSSEVADFTGDGRPDVFVTNIYYDRNRIAELPATDRKLISNYLSNRLGKRLMGNNLLVATADGFEDRGEAVGLAEGGWGWAAIAADFDNDGEVDVFHGTQDEIRFNSSDPIYAPPAAWVQHDGQFYRQDPGEIGFELTDDRGVARFDYDLDGAVDVGIATYDDEYRLYRNDGARGNSLQVVVDAGSGGGTAIGAEVTATVGNETQYRFHNARADYQSQDSRVIHLGLGDATSVDELRISWPDGTERLLENVEAGQRIRVTPDGIDARLEYGN